jgi:hypothetical protein
MSTFQIDDEIDKLVDKLTEQFKTRLRKLVTRSEKLVLKQYIASQNETTRVARGTIRSKPLSKSKPEIKDKIKVRPTAKAVRGQAKAARRTPHQEKDYEYEEFMSSSDEDSH